MLIKGPAQQLANFMVKMSQKYHKSEWAMGLEYELWNELSGNKEFLSNAEIKELQDLAKWVNGWIKMDYSANETLKFLSLEQWKADFQKNKPF